MLLLMIQCPEYNKAIDSGMGRKRGQFRATVLANTNICREHFLLKLRVPDFPASEPGQFVQVLCPLPEMSADKPAGESESQYHEAVWEAGTLPPRFHEPHFLGSEPYLRRPFSIAGRRDDPANACSEIDLIYRVIGKATGRMATLAMGDSISILGPLGNAFPVPKAMRSALLVGGGVGIPPMIYLAEKFQRAGIHAIAFIGAQKADLIPLHITGAVGTQPTSNVREFAAFNTQTVVTTDDGTLGNRGFVTQSLERFCETSPDAGAVVFCCGPTPMMRATALVAARLKLPCYASLEQPMACGMGTCQSCVIKYRPDGAEDWVYKLTCKDGPVFNTTDIMW